MRVKPILHSAFLLITHLSWMHLFAEVELNYGLQAPYWLRDSVLLWLCKIDYFSMLKFVLVAEIENKDELGGLLEW